MADFLSELASGAGLESDEAHHGLGAVLALLKDRLNPEAYAHLQNAIPNSERALSAFQDKAESTGGDLLAIVKGMAGKLLGRHESTAVQDQVPGTGLSADLLGSLLPQLHDMLAGKIPPQVLDQIKQHLPGFGPKDRDSEEE
jgi:hypothetical protein